MCQYCGAFAPGLLRVLLLAITLLLGGSSESKSKASFDSDPIMTVAGRVLDLDGQPINNATVFIYGLPSTVNEKHTQSKSGADGSFRFDINRLDFNDHALKRFIMDGPAAVGALADGYGATSVFTRLSGERSNLVLYLPAEEIVRGRIVDEIDKPIAGVRVAAHLIGGRTDKNNKPVPFDEKNVELKQVHFSPKSAGRNEAVSDEAGHFEVRGLSKDWLYELTISGPSIVTMNARLIARKLGPKDAADFAINGFPIYGSTLTHAAKYCKPIRGVVREKQSGKPIANVEIARRQTNHFFDPLVQTTSDQDGRYVLNGLLHGTHKLEARPPSNTPYVLTAIECDSLQSGIDPIEQDFELERQPSVSGQLTDRETGKPVRATVEYRPLVGNPHLKDHPALAEPRRANRPVSTQTGDDGRYTIPVLRGPGVILIRAKQEYQPAEWNALDRVSVLVDPDDAELVNCRPFPAWLALFDAYKQVDASSDKPVDVSIALKRGLSRPLIVEYPDTKETHTVVLGLRPLPRDRPDRYLNGESVIHNLSPVENRRLFVGTTDGRFAAATTVNGREVGPVIVRLKATGTITGRIVDGDGLPIEHSNFRVFCDDGPGRPGIVARSGFMVRALTAEELRRNNRIGNFHSDMTQRSSMNPNSEGDGHFSLKGLMPDIAFDLQVVLCRPDAQGQHIIVGEVIVARPTVKPGETLNLGDLKAIAP